MTKCKNCKPDCDNTVVRLSNGEDSHVDLVKCDCGCNNAEPMKKERVKLNLGCGATKLDGFVNIDICKKANPDKVMDLNEKWGFPDDSIDFINARYIMEHINDPTFFLLEAWRVLKEGKEIDILVPHKSGCGAYWYDHKNQFSWIGLQGIGDKYFGFTFLNEKGGFEVVSNKIIIWDKLGALNKLANVFPQYYEWFFPASSIRIILKKKVFK